MLLCVCVSVCVRVRVYEGDSTGDVAIPERRLVIVLLFFLHGEGKTSFPGLAPRLVSKLKKLSLSL